MTTRHLSLSNQFLIAMPTLADPNFFHSVTYLCEHTPEGALGIVINHPANISLQDILEHMDIEGTAAALTNQAVYVGGPIHRDRGFVIHQPHGAWSSSLRMPGDIGITTSRDILAAMAQGAGPRTSLIALGYAGWGPGQLEQEMAQNAWLNVPMNASVLFEVPTEQRWAVAAALGGVDLSRLSHEVGHA